MSVLLVLKFKFPEELKPALNVPLTIEIPYLRQSPLPEDKT